MILGTLPWLLSAGTFAISMSATPGPNNVMVTSSGATFGFARSLPHIAGVAIGFPLMIVAVALGAGNLLHVFPILHEVLRWGGAAYLLWLAFRIATAQPGLRPGARPSRPLNLLQAALFQWVNPKAWIIALSGIATYTDTHHVVGQALTLALFFFIVTVLTLIFWTMMGVSAARLLRSTRSLRIFNLAMSALLVASLIPLFMEV
jgi:threonine/homoserine/homoserine lactone efflux protein